MDFEYKPYLPVAERRRRAADEMARRAAAGHEVSPVVIQGRRIATTFWGEAWCDNLARYSDFANRLPRGQRYVRNGSVVDLQVAPGLVTAHVSGSELYEVAVRIAPLPAEAWAAVCRDCAGSVASLVELLQGRFSSAVMQRLCREQTGLFPSPRQIELECSCPDWAAMCKHVAAVLYGIGARLDHRPEVLFVLRQVDAQQLVAHAGAAADAPLGAAAPAAGRLLQVGSLAQLFGIDIAEAPPRPARAPRPRRPAARPARGRKGAQAPRKRGKRRTKRPPDTRGRRRRPLARAAAPAREVSIDRGFGPGIRHPDDE